MKAEEARQVTIDHRKGLVDYQMRNLLLNISEAADRGEFVVRVDKSEYPTSRDTGWLLEVIEKLKEEGYNVSTYGDRNMLDTVFINWKPIVKAVNVANEEPRPSAEPHIIKLESWWKLW